MKRFRVSNINNNVLIPYDIECIFQKSLKIDIEEFILTREFILTTDFGR